MLTRRVVVVTDVFPPRHGGSGRWLWDLYRRLPGFSSMVLAGEALGDAEFDRHAPLAVERFPRRFRSWGAIGGAGAYAALTGRIVRAIRAHRAVAVHAGKCLPEGASALVASRLTGVPLWCFAHGEELTLAGESRELRWMAGAVLRGARGVIANSAHTRRLLTQDFGVPDGRVAILHPGVDTERFKPLPIDLPARTSLGWGDRPVILTVGALQKRKGQDTLIRALPRIRERHPRVLYCVAGEGWERPYLEALARDLDVGEAVQFLGTPDEDRLLVCFQQCDLFALPNRQVGSDFEGFGIVLLEAQACGKPVVTGTSGGTRETMAPGETGVLVDGQDPVSLAEACVRLLDDPLQRQAMGTNARARVLEHFTWQVLARRAAAVFHDV